MMINSDTEGRIFLSYMYPHTNNGFFLLVTHFFHFFIDVFLLSIYFFIYLFENKLPEVPEYAKMPDHFSHYDVT